MAKNLNHYLQLLNEYDPLTADQHTRMDARVRREVIDFAAKIARTSGQTILKVTAAVWERLRIGELWVRAAHPPPFACA